MPQPHTVEAESRKFQESFMDEGIESDPAKGGATKQTPRSGTENGKSDMDDVRSRCSAPWDYESQGHAEAESEEEEKYQVIENKQPIQKKA